MRNPSGLNGAEFLDHYIDHRQCVYEDYDKRFSAYLDISPCTKHQIIMMNRKYPKIVQRDIIRLFDVGDTK